MSLTKTIDEAREVLRINSLNGSSSLPDMDEAEQKYLVPLIGRDFHESLQSKYDSGIYDSDTLLLLKFIRKPIVAYAYLDNIGNMNATITDAGVRQFTTESMPAAFNWQFRELTKSLREKAMIGIDTLLSHLEDNILKWPLWENSPGRILRNSLLIKSGRCFSENYPLFQPYRTYESLRSIISEVQDNYIVPSIGKAMFSELLRPSVDPNYVEVVRLLKKAIAHYTIKHAVEQLPVSVTAGGLTIGVNGTGGDVEEPAQTGAPSMLLDSKRIAADRDGAAYLRKAVAFLNENASNSLFQLYFTSKYYSKGTISLDRGNDRRKLFRF